MKGDRTTCVDEYVDMDFEKPVQGISANACSINATGHEGASLQQLMIVLEAKVRHDIMSVQKSVHCGHGSGTQT